MAEYQLYCFAQSGNAYRAALMLNLIGADWQPIFVDFFKAGVQRTAEYRSDVNEMGEVPVLIHGTKKLSQSGVILLYLAERSGKFLPHGEDERLEALRWILFDNQKVGGYLGPCRFLYLITKPRGDQAMLEFLKGRITNSLGILDKRLSSRTYLLGSEPTIADVSLISYLYYPPEEFSFDIAAEYKNIAAWLGRIKALPGWAIAYLGQVDADGLDPADYPVPNISASVSDPAALAEAEMRLSASVVTYAHHASVGRVHWSRVSSSILYEVKPPAPAAVLAAVADAKDVAATLGGYEPQAPNYIALKAKLADLRAAPGKAPIPNGPAPKIGAQDDRVPALRERLGLSGDGTTYDKALADAVKKYQQERELKVSGLLTQQTIDALNGRSPDRPIDTVLANLERWRWMPHDLGKDYVIVNLPDYTLRVFHDGHQVWMTRIVTGKPTMATPIMTAEMKYITVNPTWNVPPSIVSREYLPALAQDPTVLGRMGLRVSYNPDGSIHISQPPGDHNALGRLRFNFPNKFLVYQHDTPDKNLFALDKRAFSHGCMRVQDPAKYAEVLLSIMRPGEGYSEDRIHKMIAGRGEQDIQFPHYLPVHLTYQTAFVDDDRRLQFREDMYGRDQVLIAILRGEERKIAESPVDRREGYSGRVAAVTPGYYQGGYYQGGYQNNGGNFFSRLFGGGFGDAQPVPRRRAAQGRQSWDFQ